MASPGNAKRGKSHVIEKLEEEEECFEEDLSPPIPPDGGWGWVIMFASFICNFIVDGVCFSFGIFYLEFLDYYHESKSKTSWVGSVLNGMYLSMGPIVSALANKFGCRAVSMAGAVLAAVAFFLATFSPNVDILIFTYGGLGGMGFGLMYLPAIVMVGFYFEKRRAFATGVAVCGSGIGAFVFAPMCEKLLSVYEWKGVTWIIAGIVLNGVVMGALFRPLEPNTVQKRRKAPTLSLDEPLQVNGSAPAISTLKDVQPKDILKNKLLAQIGVHEQDDSSDLCLQSMHNLSPGDQDKSAAQSSSKLFKSMDDVYLQKAQGTTEENRKRARDMVRPMYRKDIFYSGSLMMLPQYRSTQNMKSYVTSVTSIPPDVAAEKNGCHWGLLHKCKAMTDTMSEMMDFSLLTNPVFALYGLSCFLCMAGFFVPFIYLPDNAVEKNMTRDQAAFLLSIIGIANTVARVLCGWISDRSWADCLLINNCALIIGGVATMCAPACNSYTLLAVYASVFGACIAVFVSLRSILMVELIGLDKLTNAFGLVTMCQGLSAFIGAPIAGALFDATGNYNFSFYAAGGSIALAGIICLPLRTIATWRKRKELANKTASLVSA